MKLAPAQLNPIVGDIAGNAALISDVYTKAKAAGADLVICPELALIGYPPEDLVLMPAFRREAMEAAQGLAALTSGGPGLIVGSVWEEEQRIYNAALLMEDGAISHVQPKTLLPNYGVFDEKRVFVPGGGPQCVQWRGVRLGLLVCEDVWVDDPAAELARQGAELLIVINASPFEVGKAVQRREVAARAGLPLVYVNLVGGQDDIVFDGGSFALDASGEVAVQMPVFEEGLSFVILSAAKDLEPAEEKILRCAQDDKAAMWGAMKLGLSDYVRKNGFAGVVLGLSGGIDSAVSAAAAVDALGAACVHGVLLPSPYTSRESTEDALETARLLGIETMELPIAGGMAAFEALLGPSMGAEAWMENPSLGGNIQARLRGMALMGLSNKFGWLLLSTGNKSEIAVGYSTLYGDSCGGYNLLKDLYKMQVYELAHWRNAQSPAIPQRSIEKPPSAELAPGQTDQDHLPPYSLLDAILAMHIEGRLSAEEIVAQGNSPDMVARILRLVRLSEYKRRQSCPGVKLSPMAFGKDRRYPLTNRF